MKARKAIENLKQAEAFAREFLTLKAQMEPLAERLDEVRKNLKGLVELCPEQKGTFAGVDWAICERVSEQFNLKKARVSLGSAVLEPFIKVSTTTYLRHK